jgi:hypothetical protein
VIVAATTTVEHFLASGKRWRHYRASVEMMKSEGWLYLQMAGPYARHPTHAAALPDFVDRVEVLMRGEVREYVETIIAEQPSAAAGTATDQPV